MTKNLFIRTYGCQMNAYDSARMADVLAPLGYASVDSPDDADLVIINTCHIREHASEKVFSELGRLKTMKSDKAAQGGSMLIAVAGCVAQAEGQEILNRAPYVDVVLGPQTYHRLPEMVARASRAGGHVLDTDFPVDPKFDFLPAPTAQGPSAFLSVQEGCDKFCTFCVVPYTRGAEYSRPIASILAEARSLVELGALEITLLGQNVNAYLGAGPDGKDWSLGRLLHKLAEIPGLQRLRYTTSHPRDMGDDLIAAHRDIPQLMPFLHLPVQSGSDRILGLMNRQHSGDDYRRIIDRLRHAQPALALSSDFIVGFPGESDADFAATLALIEDVGFAQAYSFKYSSRPGTPAAVMTDHVSEPVKEERLKALHELIGKQALAFNTSFKEQWIDVLLDRPGRHPGQLLGRSPHMQSVFVAAPANLLNTIQRLKVIGTHANSLEGALVQHAEGERAWA